MNNSTSESSNSLMRELLGLGDEGKEDEDEDTTTVDFNMSNKDTSTSEDDLKNQVFEILDTYLFLLGDLDMDGIIYYVANQLNILTPDFNPNEIEDIISEYMIEQKHEDEDANIFGIMLDRVIDEPDENIFYHSAHGGLTHHSLFGENKHILIPEFNPNKKVTIMLKTKSIIGSTVLTSQTTKTGIFGIDFKNKEHEFSDYLKITILHSRIIMVELFNPINTEWTVFYSEDIDRGELFNIPNIEFTYGETAFRTGILELVKEIDDDDSSDYVYINMNADPISGGVKWTPGPGLGQEGEEGTAYMYMRDDPNKCLIHKILSLINFKSDKEINIIVYNSSCLYNPDALKLINLYPAWAYIYKDQILLEWNKLTNKLSSEKSKLNDELEKSKKYKTSLEEWIKQREEELIGLELIIYIRNSPDVKNYLGIEGFETYGEVELRNKTYEELFNIAKDITEYPTVKPFVDIMTGIYNSNDERFSELTMKYNTNEATIENVNRKLENNLKKIAENKNKIDRVKGLTKLAQTHEGVTMYNPKLNTFAEDLDGERQSLRKKRTPQRYSPYIPTQISGIRKKRRTKKKNLNTGNILPL